MSTYLESGETLYDGIDLNEPMSLSAIKDYEEKMEGGM